MHKCSHSVQRMPYLCTLVQVIIECLRQTVPIFQSNVTQMSLNSINVPPNQRLLYLQVQYTCMANVIVLHLILFLLLKMRLKNEFLYSNWSNPRILNMTSVGLSCNTSNVLGAFVQQL